VVSGAPTASGDPSRHDAIVTGADPISSDCRRQEDLTRAATISIDCVGPSAFARAEVACAGTRHDAQLSPWRARFAQGARDLVAMRFSRPAPT